MQQGIHPEYTTTTIVCSCGNHIETKTTGGEEIHVEICSVCHPFYTGKQRLVDTAGRVERFKRKYGTVSEDDEADDSADAAAEGAPAGEVAAEDPETGDTDESGKKPAAARDVGEAAADEASDETEATEASS